MQGLQCSFIDLSVGEPTPEFRKARRFEDVSVYADSEDLTVMTKEQTKLAELLRDELDDSNDIVGMSPSLISFPTEDKRYVLFLNRINKEDQYFKLYDLQQGFFCRKLSHMHQDDEAFCISHDA